MISDDYYGDRFKWFVGVVKETVADNNRVKVRIFGIHRTDDQTRVSDGDLPEALVLMPTTGGQTGGGAGAHGLSAGTWVMGFFADGDDCQQPIVVGVIAGGQGATDNSNAASSTPGSQPGGTTPGGQGGGLTPGGGAGPTTTNLQGNGNVEKIYNFLREKIEKSGLSSGDLHSQCCGVIGNILEESNGNPNANNPSDKGERSYGICQWRGGKYDRLNPLFRFCGTQTPTLEQQLDFMWHELNTTEKNARNKLMAAQTVEQAVDAFVAFERPQCYKGNYINKSDHTYPGRLRKAMAAYSQLKASVRKE